MSNEVEGRVRVLRQRARRRKPSPNIAKWARKTGASSDEVIVLETLSLIADDNGQVQESLPVITECVNLHVRGELTV